MLLDNYKTLLSGLSSSSPDVTANVTALKQLFASNNYQNIINEATAALPKVTDFVFSLEELVYNYNDLQLDTPILDHLNGEKSTLETEIVADENLITSHKMNLATLTESYQNTVTSVQGFLTNLLAKRTEMAELNKGEAAKKA